MTVYDDYPKERTDPSHSNDQMVCFFCKKSVAEINGRLENHAPDCKYRIKKEEQK